VKSEAGQRLLQIEKNLRANGTDERGWLNWTKLSSICTN
jgi:hypothetical protein